MRNNVIKKPKNACKFCRKREAEQFCDFIYDYRGPTLLSRTGEVAEPEPITCDNEICSHCAQKYKGHGFCPSCEKMRKKIKIEHDQRKQMPFPDGRYKRGGE